MVLIHSFRAFL